MYKQFVMDDVANRLQDLNKIYDRFYKRLERYNSFGILPKELLKAALTIKDHLVNLANVALVWREMAENEGIDLSDKRLSGRAAIVRITSRMPYSEVISEVIKAFSAMYAQMQANEILQITFDFKNISDDTRE